MDKIWIVYNNRFHKRKYMVYKTEAEMAKNVSSEDTNSTILEYELKSSISPSDYFTSRERDTQLRTILGELSEHEVNAQHLIDMYEKLAKDEYTISRTRYSKKRVLNQLKKIISDKKSFSYYLVKNKNHFFQLSESVDWLLSILKCHNFQDHVYDLKRWNNSSRSYEVIDTASDTLKENFKLAKAELKKKN